MKTKVLAIALLVAATCTSAFAQQTDSKQCCKKDNQEQCGEAPQPKCPIMAALDGVQLTDAQKTAIENLGKQRAEANQQKCDQERRQRHEADSLARVAQRQERLDFLKDLKSILTADQYVSFLENSVVNAQEGPRGQQPPMGPEMQGCPGKPGEFSGAQPGQPGPGKPGKCHGDKPGKCKGDKCKKCDKEQQK
jgi:hypothetical protein